jgi:hypothetical protein
VVSDLVTSHIPIRNERVVGVRERRVVSCDGSTSIRVFAVGDELVDGFQGVRLDGIVGRVYDELRDIRL